MKHVDITEDELETLNVFLNKHVDHQHGEYQTQTNVLGRDVLVKVVKNGQVSWYEIGRNDGAWWFAEDPNFTELINGCVKIQFKGDEDAFRTDLVMFKLGLR